MALHTGYYCPDGQTVPNPYDYRCPTGHMCIGGLGTPDRCDDGYYQNEMQQDDCKLCPEGRSFIHDVIICMYRYMYSTCTCRFVPCDCDACCCVRLLL